MTEIISIERLQRENTDLRHLLHERAIVAHSLAVETLSIEHRGEFRNCPSPKCNEVRVLLGRTENHEL